MDHVNTADRRKGIIISFMIHAAIFLLMLQWILRSDSKMEVEDGGLMVAFNEVQSGGPDATTQNAATSETPSEEQDEEPTTAAEQTPVTQETVETTDIDEAPEVTSEEETPKEVTEEKKLDDRTRSLFDKFNENRNKGNADENSSSGNNPGNEGEGDPNSTNNNGGSGLGTNGDGKWSGNFSGFSISGGKSINASFKEEGVVLLDICVDSRGRMTIEGIARGTTNFSSELERLAREAATSYKFTPKSGTTTGGCGTFRVVFDKN